MDREALLLELQKTRRLCHCFEDIIENLPDTIYVTDAQARTMRVNKAYEELSGLKREEILGLHMGDMEKQYISQSGSLQVLKPARRPISSWFSSAPTGTPSSAANPFMMKTATWK